MPVALSEQEIYEGLFHRGSSWWHGHKTELEAEGFPRRDPAMGGRPTAAVMRWFAERGAVDFPSDNPHPNAPTSDRALEQRLEAFGNGKDSSAASS